MPGARERVISPKDPGLPATGREVLNRIYWIIAGLLAPSILLLGVLQTSTINVWAEATKSVPASKIGADLRDHIAVAPANTPLQILIFLRDSADLASVELPDGKLARRTAVVELLRQRSASSQVGLISALVELVDLGLVESFRPLWIVNAVRATVTVEALEQIALVPGVERLVLDSRVQLVEPLEITRGHPQGELTWNLQRIRARHVWEGLGLDGVGATVAIMDTGTDWSHPALTSNYRGNFGNGRIFHVGNWYDAVGNVASPIDPHGHGTHVAGVAVGAGGTGLAPGAKWIAVRVLDDNGFGSIGDIHAGFQWLLAPGGDPALAPDIVNASWGGPPEMLDFLPDVQALRAAGIVAVFSAGNQGPAPGSIGAPGNYPRVLAAGASDDIDGVAWFSSRGPSSLTDETKPTLVAPGTRVLSSLPLGEYGYSSGTSMAVPHVVGTLALILSADTSLSEPDMVKMITGSAVLPMNQQPDHTNGWGRLDAYAAVAQATTGGFLQGDVAVNGVGLPYVALTVTTGSGSELPYQTGPDGAIVAPLRAGPYSLTVSTFGYHPFSSGPFTVADGLTTVVSVSLTPLSAGQLQGHVRDSSSGLPLTGTVRLVDTPMLLEVDNSGSYRAKVPVGSYEVVAAAAGHRLGRAWLTVTAGAVVTQDFALEAGPRTVLVDSGQWYYYSQASYFAQALYDSDVHFDTWTIRDPFSDVPGLQDLRPYDVVVWSAPRDSPGSVGAGDVISNYLGAGGHLLVSGRDVGALAQDPLEPQFWWYNLLRGEVIGERNPPYMISGTPGTEFQGMSFGLNGPGSSDDQSATDVVRPRPGSLTQETFHYADGLGAGLAAGACEPYRIVYLGFGLEGISDSASRSELLSRSLNFFGKPAREVGLHFAPGLIDGLALPGTAHTYTVDLVNLSETLTDTFHLIVAGTVMPSRVVTPSLTLGPCQSGRTVVSVTIPGSLPPDTELDFWLEAISDNAPATRYRLPVHLKTPGHILLVDDHRWFDQEATFRAAMDAAGLDFDFWETGSTLAGQGSPSLELLEHYAIVVWYTAYDWFEPITAAESQTLSEYLEQGGRLFLTSQDYLYYHAYDALTRDFLGVLSYRESVTPTTVFGGNDPRLLGNLPGPYPLDYGPYRNFSDGLVPQGAARVSLYANGSHATGLASAGNGWRTVFWAVPFETLPVSTHGAAMNRIVGWLGDLGDSELVASRRTLSPGQAVTYTIWLSNSHAVTNSVTLTNMIPVSLTLEPATISGGAHYDPQSRLLTWQGAIAGNTGHIVSYVASAPSSAASGSRIENHVTIAYARHGLAFSRTVPVWIDSPDLASSFLGITAGQLLPGRPVTYLLRVINSGAAAPVSATVHLPTILRPLTGTLRSSSGNVNLVGSRIFWQGSVGPAAPVTVTLALTSPWYASDLDIPAVAIIDDGVTDVLVLDVQARLSPVYTYFPAIVSP